MKFQEIDEIDHYAALGTLTISGRLVAKDEAATAKAEQHHHYNVKVLGTSAI